MSAAKRKRAKAWSFTDGDGRLWTEEAHGASSIVMVQWASDDAHLIVSLGREGTIEIEAWYERGVHLVALEVILARARAWFMHDGAPPKPKKARTP